MGPTTIIYLKSLNQTFRSRNLSEHVGTERGFGAEPPSFATLNQTRAALGINSASQFQGIGITRKARLGRGGHLLAKIVEIIRRRGCDDFRRYRTGKV
jgi:hypothetical protein